MKEDGEENFDGAEVGVEEEGTGRGAQAEKKGA
jgi:hypothetical protein